jgi:glutamine synthetase
MLPSEVKTAEDAYRIIDERGLSHVKLGVFDVDGILRGKYMSRAKFFSALQKGFGFCDVVLGWDSDDQLYDNVKYTGWHTGYPDAPVRILPDTCRALPDEDTLFFLGEFAEQAEAICPRGTLRRILGQAGDMGYRVKGALEYEFFLFDETPHSAHEKGHRNLTPITPSNFGYSVLRNSVWSEWYEAILQTFEDLRVPIEGLHTETGPGVLEAALAVDEGVAVGDKAALFKTFMKVLAQRAGMLATFMAKWSNDYPGQSGHVHVSFVDDDGKGVFHDPENEHNISETMRHFIGGQQKLLPELLCMVAPTVNSFSRMVPGFWAPTSATWGVENRTTALRAIPGGSKSQRVEYRLGAADANPYIILAAAIGSGLHGIREKIEPTELVVGNAYDVEMAPEYRFPRTLSEAAERLHESKVARELFGDAFVEHFAATREWEDRQFRKHVTDWELKRYFEII